MNNSMGDDLERILGNLRNIQRMLGNHSTLSIIRGHNLELDLRYEFCRLMTDALDSMELVGLTKNPDGLIYKVEDITEEDIDHYMVNFAFDMDRVSLIFTSPLWESMPPTLHDNIFNSILLKEMTMREMFAEYYDTDSTIKELDIDIEFNSHRRRGAHSNSFNVRIFFDSIGEAKAVLNAFMADLDTFGMNHFTNKQDILNVKVNGNKNGTMRYIDDASFEKCQNCPGAFLDCKKYEALLVKLDAENPAKANELRIIVASLRERFKSDSLFLLLSKLGGGLGGSMGGDLSLN